MSEPIWITEHFAIAIHDRQLAHHGGLAGIRDAGLLSSALARPRQLLAFSAANPDIAQLAAAYAYGIAKNHPFIDGNKRTAAVVLESFIEFNGLLLYADDASFYSAMTQLADGTLSEEDFADWIRRNVRAA